MTDENKESETKTNIEATYTTRLQNSNALAALGIGATLIFVWIAFQQETVSRGILSALIGSIVVTALSITATRFYALKVKEEEEAGRNDIFLISNRSLKTLTVAGVPLDIIECIEDLRKDGKKKPKDLSMSLQDEPPKGWIYDLEAELGKNRVAEFRSALLKYTRRPAAGDNNSPLDLDPSEGPVAA